MEISITFIKIFYSCKRSYVSEPMFCIKGLYSIPILQYPGTKILEIEDTTHPLALPLLLPDKSSWQWERGEGKFLLRDISTKFRDFFKFTY